MRIYGVESKKTIKVLNFIERNSKESNLESITEIKINEFSCDRGEVACVFPNEKSTIYLAPEFFSLSLVEQAGTIIHEIAHHKYGYGHVRCLSKKIINTECDNLSLSPFGTELKFYQTLIKKNKNIKNLNLLIRKTQVRINKI